MLLFVIWRLCTELLLSRGTITSLSSCHHLLTAVKLERGKSLSAWLLIVVVAAAEELFEDKLTAQIVKDFEAAAHSLGAY